MEDLRISDVVEPGAARQLATGFVLTEGPTWHPDGYLIFADLRTDKLYRLEADGTLNVVRLTQGGNGTTFDLNGYLVQCEPKGRRLTRTLADGTVQTLVSHFQGGRLSRPNDVICRSDGTLFFTDPAMRVPYADREIPSAENANNVWEGSGIYRLTPDGELALVSRGEYPNGLALSPDEKTLYVANTRAVMYLQSIDLAPDGSMLRRRIFADMNSDITPGHPDGVKVDSDGKVFCTGPGGIWVFQPDGRHIGTMALPETAYNFAFGGPDLKTLFVTAQTSIYALQMKTPGIAHPCFRA